MIIKQDWTFVNQFPQSESKATDEFTPRLWVKVYQLSCPVVLHVNISIVWTCNLNKYESNGSILTVFHFCRTSKTISLFSNYILVIVQHALKRLMFQTLSVTPAFKHITECLKLYKVIFQTSPSSTKLVALHWKRGQCWNTEVYPTSSFKSKEDSRCPWVWGQLILSIYGLLDRDRYNIHR